MRFFYEIGIRVMVWGIRLAAVFHPKARKWMEGRRNWREHYRAVLNQQPATGNRRQTLWLHAASLGEFEQGRPVVEAFKERFPGWRIILTFFSPSGYEIRKDYPLADVVCYLPADTRRNARDFLDIIQPDAAIFVKYEFWANYLFELKKRGIPPLLVSALFRENQPFFRWYGGFWRKMLGCFTHFFVQNAASENLLQRIGFQNITVAGDTRVDRVLNIAEGAKENEIVAAFRKSPVEAGLCDLLIAGSTWPQDESLIAEGLRLASLDDIKVVFAPHDPSQKSVSHILDLLPPDEFGATSLYSRATTKSAAEASNLIIDNVGLLNSIYRYGRVAYIGGGFGKGIHNTLEPAAFGLPVIFGPKYEKFEEARQFVARGGAFPVHNATELEKILKKLEEPAFYEKASQAVRRYLEENKGATEKILSFFMQNLRKNP
ncbi:MAG: 3-deoxy-D-manno-octulosonic acid transferase [Haliscomenobacteraceae bacterium CHB4]|nr:3-deoxy-D-manno-octulosonic acid transferase [Saprospiraceae bacterium]MCE7924237.1 3-deoxy-D-manno-octulosonic acid transferase [Haliscomenobacteraceae bacterium CHB4]